MRRIEQVRLSDWAVRTLVVVTFFAYFVAPAPWVSSLVLLCSAAVGIWLEVYPEGVIGWVKKLHSSIDENDRSTWRVPRLIGAFFLLFALLIAAVPRNSWR